MTVQFSSRCPDADYLGFEADARGHHRDGGEGGSIGFDAVLVNDHIIVDQSPRSALGPTPTTR